MNRWIEARGSSVSCGKAGRLPQVKGNIAEVFGFARDSDAGSSENICRTVTIHFVKRYLEQLHGLILSFLYSFLDHLTKRSNFLFPFPGWEIRRDEKK